MKARGRTVEPFEGRLYDRPVPGLEGLAPVPSRPVDPCESYAVAKRGRRAPAIPVPVAEPKSKRGRRA